MSALAWVLERPSPVLRYAAELLSEAVGLRARFLDAPPQDGGPHVRHGTTLGSGPSVTIPLRESEPPATVSVAGGPSGIELSGDILTATVNLVTDRLHADAPAAIHDRHGRLRSRAGVSTAPLVNRYAEALADALRGIGMRSGVPRWPEERRAAIGISHDVDRPDKYAILRAAGGLRVPLDRRLPWFAARTMRDLAHRLRDRSPDDFWLFDEVVAAEADLGMQSTFLFSVMPAYGAYGSTNDVLYDAGWPHLRRAMRDLRGRGLEIGLHASYHAYRDPQRFVAERARLEELSAGSVRGLRHHFWQMGPDVAATLRAHEAAGFSYDSSIAYNDTVGLRRAIALPYRPWDATAGRPLRTWQLPVIALDSAACATARSVEEAIEGVWGPIEAVIEAGGLAVLDWHVRCAYPANDRYRLWANTYLGILRRLADRSDVWTTGLGEIAAWAQRRSDAIAAG